jgi:hypothetical protein
MTTGRHCRHCRYYGKHQIRNGKLIDQMGNQCGAITTSYAPCRMEIAHKAPDEANARSPWPRTSRNLHTAAPD